LKKILYRIFLAVNILFASSLILSYFAVHIDPGKFAFPAYFGLAYPYLLFANIVIAVIWAVKLRPEALISVLIIAAGFTHLSNYIKFRKPEEDKTATFRVLSYNLRLFNHFEGKDNPVSEKKILEFLNNQQADIILLQEFFHTGNPLQKEQSLIRALGGNYHSHLKVMGSGKNRYYGIATLSRFPVTGRGEIIHPGSSSLSIFTDILIGKDTFRIFNNHLQSFRLRRMERSFINEISGSSDDKDALNEIRSIYGSLKRGFVRRAVQARLVKEHVNTSPFPVIVAGDFNDTPVSYSYRKIRKGLNDAFVKSGYGAGFTYKGNYPPNRIDYILYDNSLDSRSFDIIKIRYSDHYPIIAYLRKRD